MSLEDRSSKLAYQMLIAVFKIVLPGAAERISATNDIVEALSTSRATRWSRNTLARQLDASADRLAQRLADFDAIEFRDLEEGDKYAASAAVYSSVEAMQITKHDILESNVNPDIVYMKLLPGAQRRWAESLVSEAGTEYGQILLREASRFLITIVSDLPDFTKDVAIENLSIVRNIHTLLERSIDSVVLPAYRSGTSRELSGFEASYRSEIIHRNKDVEIFGVRIPIPELRRQSLDIAYITLTASRSEMPQTWHSVQQSDTDDVREQHSDNVDIALGMIAYREEERARVSSMQAKQSTLSITPQKRKGLRILITGQAGSGKTTLTQWLAVRAAEKSFEGRLITWNARLPILIKLRTLFHGDATAYPSEDDLIHAAGFGSSSTPGNWLSNILNEGRALIIFDGLDELAEFDRSKARSWFETLMRTYPRADMIITSRPEGIEPLWFTKNNYIHLNLQPMSLDNIRRCIDSWFEAVNAVVPEQYDELASRRQALLNDVERRAPVQELAETPLVCAMMCAFYAYSWSESAPESRGQLYQEVIDTLVDTRDRTRKAIDLDRRRFTLKEKLTLLQALARDLSERQSSTIKTLPVGAPPKGGGGPKTIRGERTALEIIENEIHGLPAMSISARDALDYLLQRSAIFREIAPGVAQFAHRSLQEFLTGRAFATTGAALSLLDHIGSDQWDRIIAFAMGHVDRTAATALVNAILDRSEKLRDGRRGLLLLAAECLSVASVEPDLANRASRMLRKILPPRTIHEAEIIGRSGEGVIRWLANHEAESDEVVAACLRAAAVTGSPIGLNIIGSYRGRIRSAALKHELLNDWQYFDPAEYSKEILTGISLDDLPVRLTSTEMLEAARYLTDLRMIRIDTHGGKIDFRAWARLRDLQELDCGGYYGLESLDGIETLTRLHRLNLSGRDRLRSITNLEHLAQLEQLYLNNCVRLTDFSPLARLRRLRTLSLDGCNVDSLDFCSELGLLRTLRADVNEGVTDTSALSGCADLRRVELALAHDRSAPVGIPQTASLRSVTLTGDVTVEDILSVGQCSMVTELTAIGVRGLHDLTALRGMHNLRSLRMIDCPELTSCFGIEEASKLETLILRGSAIRHLDALAGLTGLIEIDLDRCMDCLASIHDLASLPNLQRILLPPVDEAVVRELERLVVEKGNKGLTIEGDPDARWL
jgi:Leucine-rich repeat (LRR) protein